MKNSSPRIREFWENPITALGNIRVTDFSTFSFYAEHETTIKRNHFPMTRIDKEQYYLNSYLERIPARVKQSWSTDQHQAVEDAFRLVMPKPSPKIVDLRITLNLIFSKFYIVLLMGKEKRSNKRNYIPQGFSRIGNWIAGFIILITINLAISLVIFMMMYYIKCSLGINIFEKDHLIDKVHQVL